MRAITILLIFVYGFLLFPAANAQYRPDTLGNGYFSRTIEQPDDYEGKVVCTLIKKEKLADSNKAVLYVHGYNDYFFQTQLGDSLNTWGYNFYAVDLRKYGRSLLPNQDMFFCKDISEYFADIDTCLSIIKAEGNNDVYLMGHSTGGLTLSAYLNSGSLNCSGIKGLILNSPFLDWNLGFVLEKLAVPIISFIGGCYPNFVVMKYDHPTYAYTLLKAFKGEWTYNTDWKKPEGHPKKAGWIRAIEQAQNKLMEHSDIQCPVLILSSDKSTMATKEWQEIYTESDIVLSVEDIKKFGITLGKETEYHAIAKGVHDLILSRKESRQETYRTIHSWLEKH